MQRVELSCWSASWSAAVDLQKTDQRSALTEAEVSSASHLHHHVDSVAVAAAG